ncbi:MAG: hypothetical protein K2J37_05655 [Ruminococcus sp.]|nr:hypothetical protein [Ruminococcus sp.]MDE6785179.1 hypothetical protein [Ruminococcus sp.]
MKKLLIFMVFITGVLVSCSEKNQNSENKPEIENSSEIIAVETVTAEASSNSSAKASNTTATQKTEKAGESTKKSSETSAKKTESGKSDSGKNKPEPENKTPEQMEFREYYPEDFTDIKLPLTIQDGEPPVEVQEFDLSGIVSEKKISPCKLPEYRGRELDNVRVDNGNFDENVFREGCNKFCDTLSAACILSTAVDGKYLYYTATYDDFCAYESHCFDIFRYDIETGENRCIFTYSDPETAHSFTNMKIYDGDLWFTEYINSGDGSADGVYRLELDSGNLEQVFAVDTSDDMLEFYHYGDEMMVISGTLELINNVGVSDTEFRYTYVVYEYDKKSGNWSIVHEHTADAGTYINIEAEYPVMSNGEFVFHEKDENNMSTAVCDNFQIQTNLRSSRICSASDKSVSFITQDAISTIMHTYNFESMEHYITDISSYKTNLSIMPAGNNMLLTQGSMCMYIIPEIGVAFKLVGLDTETSSHISFSENIISAAEYREMTYPIYSEIGLEIESWDKNPLKKLILITE